MFRLLLPLNPGKENGYQPRFPTKPTARIRPEGWRFFAGTTTDLACQTLAIPLWRQKAIMPRETGKGEKEYRKRNGGFCKWYTYRSARSRNPEDGVPPRQRMCLYMCCPCTGAKTTNREATPSYLFTRKIRGSRRPIPCHSHRIWQDAASRGFFAPPHPLRQLPRSQRLGNDPSLRLSFR